MKLRIRIYHGKRGDKFRVYDRDLNYYGSFDSQEEAKEFTDNYKQPTGIRTEDDKVVQVLYD